VEDCYASRRKQRSEVSLRQEAQRGLWFRLHAVNARFEGRSRKPPKNPSPRSNFAIGMSPAPREESFAGLLRAPLPQRGIPRRPIVNLQDHFRRENEFADRKRAENRPGRARMLEIWSGLVRKIWPDAGGYPASIGADDHVPYGSRRLLFDSMPTYSAAGLRTS
jgi:hypothetical protein